MWKPVVDQLPESFVETLFDSLGDVVYCVKDREGRYQSVNQAFVEHVDAANKAAVVGKTAHDFFPLDLAKVYEGQDRVVFNTGQSIQDQLERITHREGGMGWFLASKFPVQDGQGRVHALVGISQDLHTPSDSDLKLSNLKTLVDYIRSHLEQPLRVEQLAQAFGLSPLQLDRRMKRVFRLSTKKFIMKCRLEEAARRLTQTSQPLSEIALACGFSDQSAFTRQFRAATNSTPRQYRKSNKSEENR